MSIIIQDHKYKLITNFVNLNVKKILKSEDFLEFYGVLRLV
jgi:hypothetical protein